MSLLVIDAETVRRLLPMGRCIALMRDAMMSLSNLETLQPLRQVIMLDGGRAFASMCGALGGSDMYGAKVIGVDPANRALGKQTHQGGILVFDPAENRPVALVHAGEVTAIRTAAASAAATDALAQPDASVLAVLGYGEQARRHVEAMRLVRPIREVRVWGRDAAQADLFVAKVEGVAARTAPDPATCVAGADIVCTVTSAVEPILDGAEIDAGTHLNVVGSSYLGPREIGDALVVRARIFGDHRSGVLAQGAEFAHARDAGLIDDAHFIGEIGEVFAGRVVGRTGPSEVTIYKSLGHVVQDLAGARFLYEAAKADSMVQVPF